MSLSNPISFYNLNTYSIDLNKLRATITHKIQPFYSSSLLSLLNNCLEIDPLKRKTACEIKNTYGKYFEINSHLNMGNVSNTITEKTRN